MTIARVSDRLSSDATSARRFQGRRRRRRSLARCGNTRSTRLNRRNASMPARAAWASLAAPSRYRVEPAGSHHVL